jgi:hypothetical protein
MGRALAGKSQPPSAIDLARGETDAGRIRLCPKLFGISFSLGFFSRVLIEYRGWLWLLFVADDNAAFCGSIDTAYVQQYPQPRPFARFPMIVRGFESHSCPFCPQSGSAFLAATPFPVTKSLAFNPLCSS